MIKNRNTRAKRISLKEKLEKRKSKKIRFDLLEKVSFYQNPEFD
jgi:hypothetical protein